MELSHTMDFPLISVIVPIYNVAEYLDNCIRSITGQSYKNLEIVLINDGSTDNSLEVCKYWEAEDKRIVLISKENSGQAESRNLGLELCKGELVTFVDADDWIADDMIEKLYLAQRECDADISMCEAYTENSEGVMSSYSLQHLERSEISIQEEKDFLLTVRFTLWSKLYKKGLFLNHNIQEPSIKFEDFAVVPVLYALSGKIACVNEPLYYYRYRQGSTVRDVSHIDDRIRALQFLMDEFKKQILDEEWHKIFYKICTERGLILMRQVYPILCKRFERFCFDYDVFLKENFNIGLENVSRNFYSQCKSGTVSARLLGNYNLAVFGSYNLMIIAKTIMNLGLPDFMDYHDSFSSLISVVSEADPSFYDWNVAHQSSFREKHIIQDITKTFMHRSPCEYKDIDFLLIDFLEERFDVGEVNGKYFTLSDAFLDIKDNLNIAYNELSRFDEKTMDIWKNSCKIFVDRVRKYIDPHKIILVRTLLCTQYGNDIEDLKTYSDVEWINKVNDLLNGYYDYFMELMPEATMMDLDGFDLYTDEKFRHGCYPWHMNHELYWDIHLYILSQMKKFDDAAVDERVEKSHGTFSSLVDWKHSIYLKH